MLAAALLFCSLLSPSTQAAPAIPAPPQYYVLDEPHVLSAGALRSVESLLIEHDHLTGQQILVAIFNSLEGEDLNERTNLVFKEWKIGQRGQDNGTLLAVYWKDHKARIEVGYGLEGVLTDAKSKDILEEQLVPAMKEGDADQAISLSVIEILKLLQSPLIENGRARAILNSHERRQMRAWSAPHRGGFGPWLFLGLIALSIVFNTITSADAHFTSAGWYRPKPWRKRWGRDDQWPPRGGGGGFWGGFGGGMGGGWGGGSGGGGFSGGGGSSGGGGASAGW